MNTPAEALKFMAARAASGAQYRNSDGTPKVGNCLGSVRDAYASTATGGSAQTAYSATKERGGVYTNPPAGAPVWWLGGSKGFGHVAISTGEGTCYSTDFGADRYYGDGRVRLIPLTAVAKESNPAAPLKYVGWSSDLDGVEVLGMTDEQYNRLIYTVLYGILFLSSGLIDGTYIPNNDTWKNRQGFNLQAILAAMKAPAGASSASLSDADVARITKAVLDAEAARLQA